MAEAYSTAAIVGFVLLAVGACGVIIALILLCYLWYIRRKKRHLLEKKHVYLDQLEYVPSVSTIVTPERAPSQVYTISRDGTLQNGSVRSHSHSLVLAKPRAQRLHSGSTQRSVVSHTRPLVVSKSRHGSSGHYVSQYGSMPALARARSTDDMRVQTLTRATHRAHTQRLASTQSSPAANAFIPVYIPVKDDQELVMNVEDDTAALTRMEKEPPPHLRSDRAEMTTSSRVNTWLSRNAHSMDDLRGDVENNPDGNHLKWTPSITARLVDDDHYSTSASEHVQNKYAYH